MNVVEPENVFGLRPPVLMVILGSLVLGGLFFAIGYIVIKLGRRNKKEDASENTSETEIPKSTEEQDSSPTESGPGASNAMTNSKRARKKRREAQQEFNHSWVVGALKGHTAPVQDMNFSSNGKFLASCAEDCGVAPEEKLDLVKSSNSEATPSPPTTKEPEERVPLTRRQRKNRTRIPRDQRKEPQERDEDRNVSPDDSPIMTRSRHDWIQKSDHLEKAPKKPDKQMAQEKEVPKNDKNLQTKENAEPPKTTALMKVDITIQKPLMNCSSMIRYQMSGVNNTTIEFLFNSYIVKEEQLIHGSFPIMYKKNPQNVIICSFDRKHRCTTVKGLNVNAREFVPKLIRASWATNKIKNENKIKIKNETKIRIKSENEDENKNKIEVENETENEKGKENENENELDSGNGSGSSVENSDQEASDSDKGSDTSESSNSSAEKIPCVLPGPVSCDDFMMKRRCMRCSQNYTVDRITGKSVRVETCVYHWGKRIFGIWECCNRGYEGSVKGCTKAPTHVWSGIFLDATNGPYNDYVFTKPARRKTGNTHYGVYAVDCEMCFTRNGLELTKVSVVSLDGSVVYNEYVKPEVEIIDYNTRFSGVTAKHLEGVTKTLKDVQTDLLKFIHAETVIVGHGLENDLRALRLVHRKAVDTSLVYLEDSNVFYRRSLKHLAQYVLKKSIQMDVHDSIEDARVAMDLMLRRVQNDYLPNFSKDNINKESDFKAISCASG